ncbi:hypothetical protein TNCV_3485851 [Trichonephila clavipes]|nr:hypothetical protein TNCV_3485851 [Trichonephila clavipes]
MTYPKARNDLTKQSTSGGGEERRKEDGTAEGCESRRGDLLPMREMAKKDLSKRFFDKLPSVPNELINNQPAYDPAEPSSQKSPRALLEHEFLNFPQAKRLRVQT